MLAVDADGTVMRRSTADEHVRVLFPAAKDRVWQALIASYGELGIAPTIADPATGRYGSASFAVPSRVMGKPVGRYFDCGSSLMGAMVDAGRVTAVVLTTLTPQPDTTTAASTQVTGTLRRNDGSSSDPIICNSTGAIEEYLRVATLKRLITPP